MSSSTLDLVVPVYRNADTIAELVTVLERYARRHGDRFRAILVVDGSPDASWELLREALAGTSVNARLIRLTRNFGAFPAIRRGLETSTADITAVMSADLQEPPELVDAFYEALDGDAADIAVGVRSERDDGTIQMMVSGGYWRLFRRLVSPEIPVGGVDMFACNRPARRALLGLNEHNTSLVGQLYWIGFRRLEVPYRRRRRAAGRSGWTLRRRFRYMADSFLAFTDLPILALIWVGVLGAATSLVLAVVVAWNYVQGNIDQPGYTPIILTVLGTGSLVLIGQGIVGAYVWRTSENTKRRPLTLVASDETYGATEWESDES